jgi:hypothetical protein
MTGEKKMFTSYVKNNDSQDSIIFGDGCWNLLSAARRPTGVNSGDNRVTCTGAIALFF